MVLSDIDKKRLLETVRGVIRAELAAVVRSQKDTQEGATHEEAKPEGDKDTRATEASYLARGLAQRAMELETTLAALTTQPLRSFSDEDAVALSAVVQLEDEAGDSRLVFLLPAGAGVRAEDAGHTINVVTPKAPLGEVLLGKYVDDEVELRSPGGKKLLTVLALK